MPLIDLSLRIFEGMSNHPLHPRAPILLDGTMQHRTTRRWMGENSKYGAVSFQNEQILFSGHTGTHIDAPLHGDADGADVASITLSACVGRASVLDLRNAVAPHASISQEQIVEAAGSWRELAPIVLLHTGWTAVLDTDPDMYFRGSPGIDDGAASWLRQQGASCVGIDAPSIDTPRAVGAPAHMCFLRDHPAIVVIENLCRLDQLPAEVDLFVAAPLPMVGSSGSPIRAFALCPDPGSS